MTDKIERDDKLTCIDRLRLHAEDPETFPVDFDDISETVDLVDSLRSSNEAMREALAGSHRLFLPIFMHLAEADLAGEPIKDEAVLFSFMGSGASDHVTVGEFRKALDAARAALNEGSQS